MKRIEKAEKIAEILEQLYPKTPVPLDHYSAYTLLVAVMLSAQTMKKVNEVTPNFSNMLIHLRKDGFVEVETIRNFIQQIGLTPTKAKNLKKMAEQIIEGGGLSGEWDYL